MKDQRPYSGPDRAAGGDYRVAVRDFGAIERAEVDFRPLTVFVGPSNTGKSYLATLAYALHRYFVAATDPYVWRLSRFGRVPEAPVVGRGPHEVSVPELPAGLASWTSDVGPGAPLPDLPDSVAQAVRGNLERGDRVAGPLRAEITRSFGTDSIGELVRRSGPGVAGVRIEPCVPVGPGLLRYRMRVAEDRIQVEGDASAASDPQAAMGSGKEADRWAHLLRLEARRFQGLESEEGETDHLRTIHLRRVYRYLTEAARQPLVGPLRRVAHYLPADRTGIMHSHKMVVAALVQSAARGGLRQSPDVPILSGVLTDFLEGLIGMNEGNGPRCGHRTRAAVASQIEESVLAGSVRVESSETNYPQFHYRPEGWTSDLALMRSSSMVSELAPLVLYLRHIVGRGDVLVIEEPESHLHPAMQVEVIGRIAGIVRAGVRVVVTTHSEWILDGLANIVGASRIAEATEARDQPVLHPGEVGVWRFRPGPATRGVFVDEIEIDNDGMYPVGFDEVAVDVHNRWAELQSRADRTG